MNRVSRQPLSRSVLALLLLIADPLWATDYYLSADGRDDAPGTSARTAWRTLNQIRQVQLRPGDRVRLHGGDTFAGSLSVENVRATARQPLTVGSYGRGRAVVHAGKGDGLFFRNCSGYNNGFRCNARVGGPCGIWTHSADRIVIRRCVSVNNRTGRGLDGAGFDFDAGVSNSVLHHNVSGFNDGAGYLLYVYPNAPHRFENNVAHHNLSVNDGRKNDYSGFFIRNDGPRGNGDGVRNTRLHHNRIYQTPSPSRQSSGIYLGNTIGTQLSRNVLVSNGDVPLLRIKPNHARLTLSDNTYWSASGSLRIDMNIADGKQPVSVPVFRDVRTWSRETGYEQQNGRFTGRTRRPSLRFIRRVERLVKRYSWPAASTGNIPRKSA